jgi:4-amino-4-deoxy-L-arabinose transferase-like glycosyltransferase
MAQALGVASSAAALLDLNLAQTSRSTVLFTSISGILLPPHESAADLFLDESGFRRESTYNSKMSPWIPWLYQYGVGTAFFLVALFFVLRAGALKLSRATHRWTLIVLCTALVSFAVIHGIWIEVVSR